AVDIVPAPAPPWTYSLSLHDALPIYLRQVGAAARAHDAALVVDASQSLGAYPFDVAEIQPDFLVTVGYKWLLGPYALGYLYVARSEEHTSELQSRENLVCRLLLEKKK